MIAGSTALLDGLTPDFFRAVEGATAPVVIRILCEDYEDSNRRLDLPPEWTFAVPSTPADAAGLLRYAIRNPQPSLLIESRALQETRGEIPVRALLKPGQGAVRRKGTDLTLVTLGPLTGEIVSVCETPDFFAEVIDLRTLQPLDVELTIQSLRKTGRVLLCPQSLVLSGFVAPMMNAIHAHAFDELDAPIRVFDGLTLRKTNWQEELKRRTTMTNDE
jgi:pyruvate/2-oxoglutarate/acetoin dehydrogenase E1 component